MGHCHLPAVLASRALSQNVQVLLGLLGLARRRLLVEVAPAVDTRLAVLCGWIKSKKSDDGKQVRKSKGGTCVSASVLSQKQKTGRAVAATAGADAEAPGAVTSGAAPFARWLWTPCAPGGLIPVVSGQGTPHGWPAGLPAHAGWRHSPSHFFASSCFRLRFAISASLRACSSRSFTLTRFWRLAVS